MKPPSMEEGQCSDVRGLCVLARAHKAALGHTEPLAAQTERPLSAEVRPWRGRRDRFGACWPRLRVQRRVHRATAAQRTGLTLQAVANASRRASLRMRSTIERMPFDR